ncbi:acyltransferase family protein (plasmid) [Clostridium perfringens]
MGTLLKRDSYFDNLKGFLIFTVVLGHILENISLDVLGSHDLVLFIYIFHMPLFTFVSGYFSKKSSRRPKELAANMFKIYFLAQLGYYIFYKYIAGVADTTFDLFQPNWSLWYLLSLTCWYVLSEYVKPNWKYLFGSIILSLLLGFDDSINSYLSLSRTFFFFPFFIAGSMMSDDFINKLKKKRLVLSLATAGIIVLIFIFGRYISVENLYQYSCYSYGEYGNWTVFLRLGHYIAAFIVGATIITWVGSRKCIFTRWGKYSLVVYLVHTGVIKLVMKYMPGITTKVLAGICIVIVLGIIHLINEMYIILLNKRLKKVKE